MFFWNMLASPPLVFLTLFGLEILSNLRRTFLSTGSWNSSFKDSIVRFIDYDKSSSKDVRINLVVHRDQEMVVELFQEPDKPFQKGFVKQIIPEDQFSSTVLNGKTVSDLLADLQ